MCGTNSQCRCPVNETVKIDILSLEFKTRGEMFILSVTQALLNLKGMV